MHAHDAEPRREQVARAGRPSRATESARACGARHLLALQRMAGNAAVSALIVQTLAAESTRARRDDTGPRWRASGELWEFDGVVHPPDDPLPTEVTLTTESPSDGPFRWSVPEGADRVELASGEGGPDSTTTRDGRVQVRSRPGGGGSDDARIQVARLSGGHPAAAYEGGLGIRTPAGIRSISSATVGVASYPVASAEESSGQSDEAAPEQDETSDGQVTTTSAPKSMNHRSTSHGAGSPSGFLSRESYEVLDDQGRVMRGYEVNESFPSGKVDDEPNNWPNGAAGALTVSGASFDDRLSVEGAGSPNPQSPGSPLSTRRIYHRPQEWFVGSLTPGRGTKVQTDLIQLYLDHGEHQRIVSPP